jgi:hypothetical protein
VIGTHLQAKTQTGREKWAYGKGKIRGAERNFPDFFGLCPSCRWGGGGGGGGGGRVGVITKISY